MKQIESLMFGKVQLLEEGDSELIQLTNMILKYPANAFGTLNKMFNEKNLAILVDVLSPRKVT